MPLPLIAIGITAAGAAGALISMRRIRRDKRRYEQRRTQYEARRRSYEDFVREVNVEMQDLHFRRVSALDTLKKAADFLKRALGGGAFSADDGRDTAACEHRAGSSGDLPAVIAGIQAWKQKGSIEEAIAEMEVAEAEMGRHRAELTAVRSRTREVSKTLDNIHRTLEDVLRLASLDDLEDVHRVYLAAKALAELLDMDAASKQLPEG